MSGINQPFSTGLSDAERERLALLLEECGEVQQIIGKILRHGYESCDPTKQGSPTNRWLLENELGDLQMAYGFMCRTGDLDAVAINAANRTKARNVAKWFHFQSKHPVACAVCDRGDYQLGHHDDCPRNPLNHRCEVCGVPMIYVTASDFRGWACMDTPLCTFKQPDPDDSQATTNPANQIP